MSPASLYKPARYNAVRAMLHWSMLLAADCAEMAPPQWRGLLAAGVQANVFTGILVANCLNLGFNYVKAGWRLSLALAAVPGTILMLGEHNLIAHFMQQWTTLISCVCQLC